MRYHHMDFLRGTLMTVGVIYHTAMVLRPGKTWNITAAQGSEFYDFLAMLLHTFRMHTFFLLSGFFAAMLLSRASSIVYLRQRLPRIAVPMLVTALTLQLLVNSNTAWGVNFWLGGQWVGHLWFLANLLVYMLVTAAAYPLIQRTAIAMPYWMLAVAVSLAFMVGSSAGWRLPESPYGDFWIAINLGLLLAYFPFYLAGVYLFLRPELLTAFHSWRQNCAIAGAGGLIILAMVESNHDFRFFGYGLWAFGIAGLLMSGARHFITDNHRWVRFTAQSSYTVYLLHQPLLVLIGAHFLDLNPHAFFFLFVVGISLSCWWVHANVVSQHPLVAYLYNGKPLRAGFWGRPALWRPR